ncbi:LysR substrate-binding domain-containing protein [Dyella flava]|uniref:LysR family transcriptional regulator n=1 Tax=Dyella flava TaxID=1920170 RepID=A0ABS2JXZ6_9GAMM|nr:LysR substrate-binding domain-containing protein [Dyella flava]MBM7123855.1 LysR family transcriptional regulator [Dyella flava]GLQ52591.1 LysR family transcriptional regulator [Dyella flava]
MQFRHLRYFAKIVEAGSFSRAAALIHIAQPALSKQIAELEDEFGVTLLHRSARGVTPTVAGEVLYQEALKLIRHVDDLPSIVRSSQGDVQGVVSFGMASTVAPALTGKMLEICRNTLPHVTLRFVTGDSLTLREKVAARAVDLAIVFEDEPEGGFTREVLFRQRLYLANPKGSKRALPISLSEISALPLVLPTPTNVLRRVLDRAFAQANITLRPIAESDLFDVMLSAVETGLGHAVMPKGDFSDVPGHQDIGTTPIEPPIYLTACLVTSQDVPLTQAALAVEAALLTFIRGQLDKTSFHGAEWVEPGQP